MQINLTQILPCQLECKFCANSKINVPIQLYDLKKFMTVVDICTEYGIDSFDLTPNIGDFLLDKEFEKKVISLELNPKVKSWNFVTNFLSPQGRNFVLLPFSKGSICISVYGLTQEDYFDKTGQNMFSEFCDNLWYIIKNAKDLNIITIYTRYNYSLLDCTDTYFDNIIYELKNLGAKEDFTETQNKNWGGIIKSNFPGKEKNGICQHAICDNGIFPDGDMTLCNCWDTFKTLYLGNIFEESLKDIYSENSKFGEFIKGQMFGKYTGICEKCNDFELVDIDNIEIDWLKKYKKIIKQTREQR